MVGASDAWAPAAVSEHVLVSTVHPLLEVDSCRPEVGAVRHGRDGEGLQKHEFHVHRSRAVFPEGVELVDDAPGKTFATGEVSEGVERLLAKIRVFGGVRYGSAVC